MQVGAALSVALTGCNHPSRFKHWPLHCTCDAGGARVWYHELTHPGQHKPKEVPTLEQFAPGFLNGHARANRRKPSGINATDSIIQVHLIPLLGWRKLDAITTERVQGMKHHLRNRAPKTVNNVLTVLNMLLKKAVEWSVIERMPCTIRLLPIPKPSAGFHDFAEFERLVTAARELGWCAESIQELARHQELGTTQRYMHLSPAALESAIRLLDTKSRGDILETGRWPA